MNELTLSPSKPKSNSKFSDGQLVELHSQGISTPMLAKQLGVSRRSVCARMKKIGLKANVKPGSRPKYEKVGSKHFRCASCRHVKPLRQRNGTICCDCQHERYVNTKDGALHFRYSMKKSVARRKGIPFNLTFEYFKGLFEQQDGKDGYTGEQMSFSFGHGLSRTTASLDRIDNEGGYNPENVLFCCHGTNSKKKGKPVQQFVEQLKFNFSSEAMPAGAGPNQKEESNPENTL